MVAAGSVFFDVFVRSSAEGRQGSGTQPGSAGVVPLLQGQRNAEWCKELWFIFSYSLNFLIKIQLLFQSSSLQLLIQLINTLSDMHSIHSPFQHPLNMVVSVVLKDNWRADEWGYDETVAHWCKDKWRANGGVPYCFLINPLRDIFTFSSTVGLLPLS